MTKNVLILGATGRFGRHMQFEMQTAGWKTHSFDRKNDTLATASQGMDVIAYGWNPAYNKWDSECFGQLQQVIDAARVNKATILFPGNIYIYGSQMPAILRENTPHVASNTLGKIRTKMEIMLRDSGVKTIILRAGDFLDTEAKGHWFDMIITKKTHKTGKISYPGNPDITHAWAFLPDFARAFVALADKRNELPNFTTLNFAGYTLSGTQIANLLNVGIQKMGWLPIQIARPFWPIAKHLLEMRYLWNTPHRVDGSALLELLPDFRETPVEAAMQAAVSFDINPNQTVIGTGVTA